MSEIQHVMFQAVDRPLDDKQLEFAQRQSTRADVSRWSMSVEYHYSSFRGDVAGLLRNGYDVFLQYTSYGDRVIKMRLPHGMPFAESVWSQYLDGEKLAWEKDAKGPGGILSLSPFFEAGDLGRVLGAQHHLDAAIGVRELVMRGDLRALYLLWVCAAADEYNDPAEMIEPPVPFGISDVTALGGELLWFFGLDPLLLVAAGKGVERAPKEASKDEALAQWVQDLPDKRSKDLLQQLLSGDTLSVKADLLAEARKAHGPSHWPTKEGQRTLGDLYREADALRSKKDAQQARKAKAKADREHAKRMKELVEDPKRWLREAEQLVEARGTQNYESAAEILRELREAVGGDEGETITRRHARHLTKKHPTLTRLKSSLRKRNLIE